MKLESKALRAENAAMEAEQLAIVLLKKNDPQDPSIAIRESNLNRRRYEAGVRGHRLGQARSRLKDLVKAFGKKAEPARSQSLAKDILKEADMLQTMASALRSTKVGGLTKNQLKGLENAMSALRSAGIVLSKAQQKVMQKAKTKAKKSKPKNSRKTTSKKEKNATKNIKQKQPARSRWKSMTKHLST